MQRLLLVWQDLEVREKATIALGIQCSNRRAQTKTEHDSSAALAAEMFAWAERVRCERLASFPAAKRDHTGRASKPVAALAITALRQKSFDHAKGVIVSFRPFTLTRTGNV